MNILNGKLIASRFLDSLKEQINVLSAKYNRQPKLAVIVVGHIAASAIYVRNKQAMCDKVGILSHKYQLSETCTEEELIHTIDMLNNDITIDGILLQLPLPHHMDANTIINRINQEKDVDGFHRVNLGGLFLGDSILSPCTPKGIITMLDSIDYSYLGKMVVIIGSSNIVGKPMALEFINRKSTVTICNSSTRNLTAITKMADLIVIAIGKAKFLQVDMVKQGVIIIDVGINRLSDGTVCGDADFEFLKQSASYITPVPGGVGPMTIAMLLHNTVSCFFSRQQ